jgi:hypothetical protein
MDHQEQHHLKHQKEREHKKQEHLRHERQGAKARRFHPAWIVVVGVALSLAAMLIWTLFVS